ncbi:MAG: hypothetical protein IJ689_03215 [Alphaproteobacteria bacterium]|nr:hypothetical protein [Alphaproteobacteria bacterium]
MKKIIAILMAATALSACENLDLSQYATAGANDPVRTRLRACLVSEATARLQAGTLLNNGVSAAADEITNTCIKKLALQAAGLDNEAASTATSIIGNLLNGASAQ